MSDYTPTTKTVLAYIRGNAVMAGATANEAQDAAVGWLASVERAAAEKAWDEGARWAAGECGASATENVAWIAPGENPYHAEAYRREGKNNEN